MRAFVVGLGSMGKRRIRNLRELGVDQIIGTDERPDRTAESVNRYNVIPVPTFADGLATDPDIVIVSTPPHKHLEFARQSVEAGKHVFTEFSWTEDPAELDRLDDLCTRRGVVGAPSCTMRFQESVRRMCDLVSRGAIGRVLFLLYHSGQWAPDWHPWESITEFYLGHKHMGGGREQVCFELDWIRWVLGPIRQVSAVMKKMTTLPTDIDDLNQITLTFESGAVASVTVDMIQRSPNRLCAFLSEDGQMTWDYTAGIVRVYTASDQRWVEYRETLGSSGYFSEGHTQDEPLYAAEIRAFLDAVEGKARFPNRYCDERSLVSIVHELERSAREGRQIAVTTEEAIGQGVRSSARA